MATIGGTSSATLSLQQTLLQGGVPRARRQPQGTRQNSAAVGQDIQGAPENAGPSRPPATRTESVTYAARQGASRSEVPEKTQDFLVRMYSATADKFAADGNPLKSDTNAGARKNSLGQTTGRILSLSA